jgi:hypothetical protein
MRAPTTGSWLGGASWARRFEQAAAMKKAALPKVTNLELMCLMLTHLCTNKFMQRKDLVFQKAGAGRVICYINSRK